MPVPERRTPADIWAAVAIAVAVLVAAVLIWQNSQERHTVSTPAAVTVAAPPQAVVVPAALRELWQAPDRATAAPVTVAGVVVTGDGGTVLGRDPATGRESWRYQRDLPLCGIPAGWGSVIAVYRDRRGCGQAVQLAATGARMTARSGFADETVAISGNDSYLLVQGPRRLELWRSDLVRTLEYGFVDAPVNPNSQPRSHCTLLSAGLGTTGSRLAVLERCPGEAGTRLTFLNPSPKDASKPEEYGSTVLPETTDGGEPRLLLTTGEATAVYLPGSGAMPPRLGVYDNRAKLVSQHSLSAPLSPGARVQRAGYHYLLWTGRDTLALDPATLAPGWTAPETLGPGAIMAGRILIPVSGGIAVVDPVGGAQERRISFPRTTSPAGPITLDALGATVLEQYDGTLHALGG
ncbi:MAG: hypothetical protein HOQ24_19230 [Mycobacteriaceae bacterium]|nr:hypothetical protein [Mycobacteriaceae bacterium]